MADLNSAVLKINSNVLILLRHLGQERFDLEVRCRAGEPTSPLGLLPVMRWVVHREPTTGVAAL
jgi:hypothetical protein